MHYCGGKVSSVSFSGIPHSCSMEATNDISCLIQGVQKNTTDENLDVESCCLTLSYFTQSIPAALINEKVASVTTDFFALPVSTIIFGVYNTIITLKHHITHLKIPLSERSIILLVQSFLL